MNELSKIKRVMQKVLPEAPHEVLLVLNTVQPGQNAFEQAKQFTAADRSYRSCSDKARWNCERRCSYWNFRPVSDSGKIHWSRPEWKDLQSFNGEKFVDSFFKRDKKYTL